MTEAKDFRNFFIAGVMTLILVAATPTIAMFVHLPSSSASFSELSLLGPELDARNYPFNIKRNETYRVYVSVGNRLGQTAYYQILVKLCNQTQASPVTSNSTPSTMPALYQYNFFAANGDTWQSELTFSIENSTKQNQTSAIERMIINRVTVTLDPASQATWNITRAGFYYQLLLELWRYNLASEAFQYDNRFVGLWLNVTDSH